MLSKWHVERKILWFFGREGVSSLFGPCKVDLLPRVQPENFWILCKIQGAINLATENDQPLWNVLVPPQFGIKLLITDALLEECTSVWENK